MLYHLTELKEVEILNPLENGNFEATINYCSQHAPDFETVGSMIKRYGEITNGFDAQMRQQIDDSKLLNQKEASTPNTVITIRELGGYLQNVIAQVFLDNKPAHEGILEFIKNMHKHHSDDQELLSTDLPDWIISNAQHSALSQDFVTLITSLSAAHYYQKRNHSQGIQQHMEDTFREGHCPTCGLMPHFSVILGEEGYRIMECWLCGTRWRFSRLECPDCHETKQDKLGYFQTEAFKGCRISFCRNCEQYIKVFDLREWADKNPSLWILHLATLMCDDLAVNEGFMPVSRMLWHDPNSVDTIVSRQK
jgi:formate dehydrogenase accessory protein FdhE